MAPRNFFVRLVMIHMYAEFYSPTSIWSLMGGVEPFSNVDLWKQSNFSLVLVQ